jgi:hypothetical protein
MGGSDHPGQVVHLNDHWRVSGMRHSGEYLQYGFASNRQNGYGRTDDAGKPL